MEFFAFILIIAATFGLCRLADLGFTKAFRSAPQHKSGMSVRLNRHFGGIGTVVLVLGILGILGGIGQGWVLIAAGAVLVLVGGGLVAYYMTFGVYYDDDSFVLSTFGRRSETYRFQRIRAQQLYNSYGKITIELYLDDGRSVQLHSSMSGVYQFMDKAFAGWLRQRGLEEADCPFHDPDNSCWFPTPED